MKKIAILFFFITMWCHSSTAVPCNIIGLKKNKGLKELIFKNSQKAVIDVLRIKDDIYYGNYWILFNDGCYYLFAAYYNVETNVTELRPMNFFNYATAYQKCMPPDEWAAFC